MARPKKVEEMKIVPPFEEVTTISKLDISFGREDLNAIAQKINELIDAYNAK